MVWQVTLGGVTTQQTFNQDSFSSGAGGNAYADETTGLPAALQRVVEQCRDIFLGSSSTSATIGTGSYSFTSTPNRPWVANLPLKIVDGSNSANYMTGAVTSYDASAGTLVFAASASAGSGTISSWSITISGTGPAGPAGPTFTGGALTALTYAVGVAINLAVPVDVATATTANIGAASSNMVRLTGTTTVESFGSIAALNGYPVRIVRCDAAFQLTHNSSSMILPAAGANITTAANDWFIAVPLGSSNWAVTFYQRANGTSVVSSTVPSATTGTEGIVFIATSSDSIAATSSGKAVPPSGLAAYFTAQAGFSIKTSTSSYTVTAGARVMIDATAGISTVTLPASATAGDGFVLGTYGSYAITLARNGLKIAGISDDAVIPGNTNEIFTFVYLNATYGWVYGGAP